MSTTLEQRLATILTDRFGVPTEDIEPGVTFDELAVDSLIIVELVLVLRKELGIALSDWELTPDLTIEQAAKVLSEKLVVTA